MIFKAIKNLRFSFPNRTDFVNFDISIDGENFFPMSLDLLNQEQIHQYMDEDMTLYDLESYIQVSTIEEYIDPLSAEEKLALAKTTKTNQVNNAVKTLILSGFTSAALGDSHKYQSDETDQLNLIGAVTSGVDQAFKCSADGGVTWAWKIHTIEQLQVVLRDGALYKNKLLEDASTLKSQIQACTTLEKIEALGI